MKPTLEFIEETHSLRKDYRNISRIFSYGRPALSENETYFVERFVKNPHMIRLGMAEDKFVYKGKVGGNLFLLIGKNPKVLFSCHTDTVDRGTFPAGAKKGIVLDINSMRIKKENTSTPCLGADDGTGIWLCWELIKAGVEGLYIFHRAEEVGGVGSSYIANNNSEELEKFDFAVAFDRKDMYSIITQQVGQICASQAFVDSLAEQLDMDFRADPTGSFTDTANYTDYIPECTNLSVGYYNAHSGNEEQDLKFVREFRDALIKVDWNKVVAEREPGVLLPEITSQYTTAGGYGTYYYDDFGRARGINNATSTSYNQFGRPMNKGKKDMNKKEFLNGYDNYYERYLTYVVAEYNEILDDETMELMPDIGESQETEKIDEINIKVREINEGNPLDSNFVYDDWQNFFR
jgi:hypothetical protein